jgi:hypothetical protein
VFGWIVLVVSIGRLQHKTGTARDDGHRTVASKPVMVALVKFNKA